METFGNAFIRLLNLNQSWEVLRSRFWAENSQAASVYKNLTFKFWQNLFTQWVKSGTLVFYQFSNQFQIVLTFEPCELWTRNWLNYVKVALFCRQQIKTQRQISASVLSYDLLPLRPFSQFVRVRQLPSVFARCAAASWGTAQLWQPVQRRTSRFRVEQPKRRQPAKAECRINAAR